MPVILDPEQRAQAIAQRERLLNDLNQILALSDDERRQQSRINRLQINHGREEVGRLLLYMTELLNTETEDLDAFHYQRYHESYRHFGGNRPALDVDQWQALNDEFTGLHVRVVSATHVGEPVGASPLSQKEQKRYAQLKDTLLNDSFLWDDITPQDPGQHNLPSLRVMMRQFRKRRSHEETPVAAPSNLARAPMFKADAPLCPKHDMPILRLSGRPQCVQEYLEGCIVGKRIVDVRIDNKVGYYHFDDGHILPLICGCCGDPYKAEDIADSREEMIGYVLLSLSTTHSHNAAGKGYDELVLNFGGPNLPPTGVPVAFTAVARLLHPADCAQSKG